MRLLLTALALALLVSGCGGDDPLAGIKPPDVATESGGWGLQLVDSVSDDWGVDEDDDAGCTTVWTRILRQL